MGGEGGEPTLEGAERSPLSRTGPDGSTAVDMLGEGEDVDELHHYDRGFLRPSRLRYYLHFILTRLAVLEEAARGDDDQ